MSAPAYVRGVLSDTRTRQHHGYYAFVVHRVSGLALTLFLPVHFWALSQALDPTRFDRFIAWSQQPAVKFTEIGVVAALAAHFAGGLRLLFVELVGWRAEAQKSALALGAAFVIVIGLMLALGG